MSEQVLTVLKFCLLALLYLFLARVVWVVVGELRGTPAVAPRPAPAPAATRRRRQWRIVVRRPEANAGKDFPIEGDVTIGRGAGCTLTLTTDTFASQVHARLNERDSHLWIEDLGSTNGTFVNGKRVSEPVRLRKGDQIQIGETVFEVDA
jgi:hypothetical protein